MAILQVDSEQLDASMHHFKTDLTVIQGAALLLRDQWDELESENRDALFSDIEQGVRSLSRQIKTLRTEVAYRTDRYAN